MAKSIPERIWLIAVAPLAVATCLVGGLILRPPFAAYVGLAFVGAVLAGIPAMVVDLLHEYRHQPDSADHLDGHRQ